MSWPEVGIIVLNWNRAKDTEECLKSVFNLDYPEYKVVLVDNGSTEPASLKLKEKFPSLIFLRNEKNLGFAGGNNVGIRCALEKGADYVFLLNNDVVVDGSCLKELVDIAQGNRRTGIIGPAVYSYQRSEEILSLGGDIQWWRGKPFDWADRKVNSEWLKWPRKVRCLSGCALLVRRDAIEKVGYLAPEYFLFYEESEWCVRMKSFGFRILFSPRARIWHKVSSTTGGTYTPRSLYYGTRNRLLFMKRNAKRIDWWIFIVFIFPLSVVKNFIRFLLKPKHEESFFLGVFDFLRGQYGYRY